MNRVCLLVINLLTLGTFLIACGDESNGAEQAGSLRVVATTTQIGDFAANIGGDRIVLTVLLGANQDAHDFELVPSQVRSVSEADIVLRNGVGLDDFIDRALEGSRAAVVDLSAGIELREGDHGGEEGEAHDEDEMHQDGDEHEGNDPHIWFSVENAKQMAANLRDALSAEDAANAAFYSDNTDAYLDRLAELDVEIRAQVDALAPACRKLATNYEVLGYYAAAYGFESIGSVIPATTTEAQASASDVAEIVRLIREQEVPAIFAEASSNPALVEQVAREAGITVISDFYGDSLGAPGSDGATYIEMMRSNTSKIVDALKTCGGG